MRKALACVGIGLLALLGVVGVRTASFVSKQPPRGSAPALDIDPAAAAARLAGAIAIPTVSHEDPQDFDHAAFLELHDYLSATYPLVHGYLELETVAELSRLYRWPGRDPKLPPVVLMAHSDVVPVAPGTEARWTHPPFAGVVAEGFVWGRGTLDDKGSLLAILEAVEAALKEGLQPERTVFLAFGHDEEVGGRNGAQRITQRLSELGHEELAMVLDEGGVIAHDLVPGLPGPTALVGIAEKGFLSLELSVEVEGGHSSMPPASTSVGILSRAIARLEAQPFPARLEGATGEFLAHIGPELPLPGRAAMANLWLFGPLVKRQLEATPAGAASLRTTTAATIFEAGVRANVLPIRARAVVNFRILPGETTASVTERVRSIVDDERVQIRQHGFAVDPSPLSRVDGPGFGLVSRTLREIVAEPDLIVAPYLVVGGTDARYYSGRSDSVLRFLPVPLHPDDLGRIHGTDERISVDAFAGAIRYYHRLLENLDALGD